MFILAKKYICNMQIINISSCDVCMSRTRRFITPELGTLVLWKSTLFVCLTDVKCFPNGDLVALGKLHSWEVATWENTLGKMPLGKYLTLPNQPS